jgi:hypothetical protein
MRPSRPGASRERRTPPRQVSAASRLHLQDQLAVFEAAGIEAAA